MWKFYNWFKIKPSQKKHQKTFDKIIFDLQRIVGYKIVNREYYIKALTHRSFLELSSEINKSNERLEFLGDSILGLVTAEFLFENFLDEGEGFLTKSRSHFVKRSTLALTAENINLKSVLLYNSKFIGNDEKGLNSILADALEALIGAIYLDKGLSRAKEFIYKNIVIPNYKSGAYEIDKNFKGQLLELAHSNKLDSPVYKLIDEYGPEHNKTFTVEVISAGKKIGKGIGKNKKSAEQRAAQDALKNLRS